MHGRSFAPSLRGEGADHHRDVAICACFLGPLDYGQVPNKAVPPMLYTKDWAYRPAGPEGGQELYDRHTDPLAARNVAAEQAATVAELREQFGAWLSEHDAPESIGTTLLKP